MDLGYSARMGERPRYEWLAASENGPLQRLGSKCWDSGSGHNRNADPWSVKMERELVSKSDVVFGGPRWPRRDLAAACRYDAIPSQGRDPSFSIFDVN
jgi:hypothetical protein